MNLQNQEQKPITLQEAKDFTARKYSVDNFNLTVWMTDEAAELYCSSLKKEIDELRAENERLRGEKEAKS